VGWREGDLDIDGARFHYYRRGRGRPLVLAHGAGDSGDCWTRVAAALEDDYDVVAYDARYHGLSDATPGPGGGADLIAVVEKLGLERPALMGHSMGAGSVIRACAARPEMFRRAVLEDPGLRLAAPGGVTPARNPTDYSTMTAAEIEAEGRARSPMWDEVEWSAWARSKKHYRPPADGVGSFSPPDAWRASIAAMALPTLLVYGGNRERGAIVSDEVAAIARELNPRLTAVKLANAGHNVRREAYEDFVKAVMAFLAAGRDD
jgi:pimeloyl-ACP methyl ester carboxylesterase